MYLDSRTDSGVSCGLSGLPRAKAVSTDRHFSHGPSVQCTRATSVFNRPSSAVRSRAPWPEVSRLSR